MQKVQRSSLKYATNKIVYYDMSALSSGRNKIFNCAAHIHTHSYRENISYSLYFTRCLCPAVPKINKERNIKCSPHSAAIHTHTQAHPNTVTHTRAVIERGSHGNPCSNFFYSFRTQEMPHFMPESKSLCISEMSSLQTLPSKRMRRHLR